MQRRGLVEMLAADADLMLHMLCLNVNFSYLCEIDELESLTTQGDAMRHKHMTPARRPPTTTTERRREYPNLALTTAVPAGEQIHITTAR